MNQQIRAGDIAVIGMAGRFPGAATVEQFWHNLRNGVDSVTHFTDDDLRQAGVDEQAVRPSDGVRAGAVLADADCFDATLFGISPAEVELMDPQHRIFLECAWSAMEDAGYGARHEPAHVGVFAGTSMSGYLLNVLLRNSHSYPANIDLRTLIGNDKDHLTARIAYRLDLIGPAVTVQSACSTSLVAVHLAAQSVLNGECAMALAGGVSIGNPQVSTARYVKGGIVSRDGHLRAFDADADGIVGGSGVGVVLLKGLTEALADRDHIHAVIKGSAVNNDGRAKIGYSAPSQQGQARAIRSAMAAAEIEPMTVGYIEAHGTGTPLGDPIEIAALAQAYSGAPTSSCLVGSVKSNIGHLDAAAGVAGLIKTVLCLQHREIAPSLHVRTPNPELHLASTPFRICDTLTAWPAGPTPRRAGVSAFGIGGTNAHVVLEEAPTAREGPPPGGRPELLVLSARLDETLETIANDLADHLDHGPDVDLADVAFTLQTGRSALNRRRIVVASTASQAAADLRGRRWLGDGNMTGELPVIFMFAGQGGELLHAGDQLRHRYRTFAATVDHCADLLRPLCGFDVRAALSGTAVGPAKEYGLADTIVAQPTLFVLEYALGQLWMDWGITPVAMIGHSLGEYAAACHAGVLTLEGALAVVAERARLMQQAAPGAMLVAALAEHELADLLADAPGSLDVELAAVNSPRNCVLSGPTHGIAQVAESLTRQRIPHRRLATQRAFHSASMDTAAERVGALIAEQRPAAPKIPYVTTLTGDWAAASDVATARHWARQTREPVRFHRGLQALAAVGAAGYLELGPGDELAKLSNASGTSAAVVTVSSLTPAGGSHSEDRSILTAAGLLWAHGTRLDLPTGSAHHRPRRVPLPTYPFDHHRHWTGPQATHRDRPTTDDPPRDPGTWLYASGWRCVTGAVRPPARPDQPRWFVHFRQVTPEPDDQQIGAAGAGDRIIEVRAGSRFSVDARRSFTIDPTRVGDYVELATELSRIERLPLHFVMPPPTAGGRGSSAAVLTPLLYLARAIALKIPSDWPDVRLYCMTTGAQAVAGETVTAPQQALLAGAITSIARELSWVRCCCIDLPANPQPPTTQLLAYEVRGGTRTGLMAIRAGRLFVPTIESMPANTGEGTPRMLRDNGVYLITGGLGGVGGTIARYLASTVAARLVIVSRSADRSRTEAQDRTVRAIRQAAGTVLLVGGDVACPTDMHRAHAAALARFGPVNGIVHAAGVAAAGMVHSDQATAIEAACPSKVDGTLVLSEVFGAAPLDFVTLCSSLVSVVGAPAQAAYAAANAYLDVIPFAELFPGALVQTINWDTWREVGMAVNTAMPAELDARRQDSLVNGISPTQGAQLFVSALASEQPRLIVSTREPRSRNGRAAPYRDPAYPATDSTQRTDSTHRTNSTNTGRSTTTPHPAAPASDRLRAVEDALCRLWSQALRMPSVQPDDNVFELGADSLVALQVVANIEQAFSCQLSPIVCYEAPTARLLARLITGGADGANALAMSEARGRRRQRGLTP